VGRDRQAPPADQCGGAAANRRLIAVAAGNDLRY
jgi:hypothetical protein